MHFKSQLKAATVQSFPLSCQIWYMMMMRRRRKILAIPSTQNSLLPFHSFFYLSIVTDVTFSRIEQGNAINAQLFQDWKKIFFFSVILHYFASVIASHYLILSKRYVNKLREIILQVVIFCIMQFSVIYMYKYTVVSGLFSYTNCGIVNFTYVQILDQICFDYSVKPFVDELLVGFLLILLSYTQDGHSYICFYLREAIESADKQQYINIQSQCLNVQARSF